MTKHLCNSSNTRRWTFKVQVLFEKASLFNARGLCNPGKVRRRVFELTSQTYQYLEIFQRYQYIEINGFIVLNQPAFAWENFKSATYFEDSSSSSFKRLIKHEFRLFLFHELLMILFMRTPVLAAFSHKCKQSFLENLLFCIFMCKVKFVQMHACMYE